MESTPPVAEFRDRARSRYRWEWVQSLLVASISFDGDGKQLPSDDWFSMQGGASTAGADLS